MSYKCIEKDRPMFVDEKTLNIQPVIDSPVRNYLLGMIDVLERDGWCQHSLHDAMGRYCVLGASYAVAYEGDVASKAAIRYEAIMRLTRAVGVLDIGYWNDRRERTKDQVIKALKVAAGVYPGASHAELSDVKYLI
jgi:hypothetical protein